MSPMITAAITSIKIPRVIFPHVVSFIFVFDSVSLSRKNRKSSVNMSKV